MVKAIVVLVFSRSRFIGTQGYFRTREPINPLL